MGRAVEEATVEAFRRPDPEALKADVHALVAARDSARHLEALRWRAPFQAIRGAWKADLSSLKVNPRHLNPGPHT